MNLASVRATGPRLLRSVRRRLCDWWRGETDATFFPIHDPALLDAHLGDGPVAFVLRTLAGSPRLRRRFPTALSDGAGSRFAARVGLRYGSPGEIRAAFASRPGGRCERVFAMRPDLRAVFPLGLTPGGRGGFLRWMLTHGRNDLGLTAEEIFWFFFELDEDRTRGLEATYRLTPDWQRRFPDGLTRAGWPRLLAWLRAEYGLAGRWVRRLPDDPGCPDAAPTAGPGVNLLAHYRYPSGLQQAALGIDRALVAQGVPVSRRDLPVGFECDWNDRRRYDGVERYDTSIATVAANTPLAEFADLGGLHLRDGVYRVAVWYWELARMPRGWSEFARQADEIWAPTTFIAGAMREATDRPVYAMPPALELPPVTPRPRHEFGLEPEAFLFLFVFDMASVMERKNPLGLIRAFRRAFSPSEPVRLAVKVSKPSAYPADRARLLAASEAAGVTVIDRTLSRDDTLSLIASADCYVSLHRSEGLGLTMAEAMLLGKPVIATGYSGNLDFMSRDASWLVDHRVVEIAEDHPPYMKGAPWAEPDEAHAAELMRRAFERPDEAAELGRRARPAAAAVLSVESAGRRMAERLRAIARRPR